MRDEYEKIECTYCSWSYRSKDRVEVLKMGFWHVIGNGGKHDVYRKEEMETEFDL